MKNTNFILNDPRVQRLMDTINRYECDRIYCVHDLNHFLSVARICMIRCFEKGLDVNKDMLYSMSLLHDLGRAEEYENGIDHSVASRVFAEEILKETSFTADEQKKMIAIIEGHRKNDATDPLAQLFYEADKLSRDCYNCISRESCYWSDEKKNLEVIY